MSQIQLLTEEVINKIAAGEVIERPASVVKELVENALDAGATKIKIELEDYGKALIKVSDNGAGMDEENARKSILRHATSKISSAEDLFSIHTLGFRGEALSSIAAVSKFSLTTKQKSNLEAFNLVLEGGRELHSSVVGAEDGTMIEIKDLFFNTPVRKKFLKSDPVELKHILEVIQGYALVQPQVSFKLTHDGKELLLSPAANNLRERIASIYGLGAVKDLLEVNFQNDLLQMSGFISKPYQARNDKTLQLLFVNKRVIRNEEINNAIYEGYHSVLFVGKHPVFFLNLTLDAQQIDVNVHPTKREIKISRKEEVQAAVTAAIKEVLQQNNLIPEFDLQKNEQLVLGSAKKVIPKYQFEKGQQSTFQVHESAAAYPATEDNFIVQNETIIPQTEFVNEEIKIPALKLLGQIKKTFFVAETSSGMILIDQHVVQERVLYERFMEQYLNKKVAVQNLLQGEIVELSPSEKIAFTENKERLESLGFTLENFGSNSFLLKTIPTIFGRLQPKELLFTVLSELNEHRNKLEEIQEEIITRMACRASVKAGDTVTIPEMQKLLAELSLTKIPYTCPHGRAIFIHIPTDELEKKFRRK